jgi:hypothetical protein
MRRKPEASEAALTPARQRPAPVRRSTRTAARKLAGSASPRPDDKPVTSGHRGKVGLHHWAWLERCR